MTRPDSDPQSSPAQFSPATSPPNPQSPLPNPKSLPGRLANLTLPQQVAILAIWPLLEQVLNFLVTFVDTMRAGHLSADAVTAVGTSAYIIWVVSMVQGAVGVGSTAIVARAIGGHHRRLANATLGQSLALAGIAGVVMGAAMYVLAGPISRFVELTGQSLEFSTLFLRILALATPLSFILFVGGACLRGAGDTATPFVIMVVVNVVNIAANYAFVLGPAPLGGHGVAGIAAATDLAWGVGALLMVVTLLRGWGGMRLYLHRLALQWHMVKRIVRVGLPNLAESSGTWVGQFLVFKIIGHIGRLHMPEAVGIHTVAIRIEGISYLPGTAMSVAAATLAGQYLGIGDPARARRAVKLCWIAGVAIMGTVGVMFLLIPRPLIAIITNDPVILQTAPTLLRIAGPSEVFLATYLVLAQAFRGAGDTRMAMGLSYFSVWCVRLPLAYLLGLTLGYGLVGVWFALCGELVFRAGLFAWRFWQGGWLKAKV